MAAIAENYSLGLQVELGKIDSELKKLWAQTEGAMTRASLVNLAVYSEAPGSLEKNTQLIAKIAENHACRAIVIGADCKTKEDRVEAWISAHCHISRTGSKQICSGESYSRTSIRTCRFIFGGRASFVSRWTGSFGRGSIG